MSDPGTDRKSPPRAATVRVVLSPEMVEKVDEHRRVANLPRAAAVRVLILDGLWLRQRQCEAPR